MNRILSFFKGKGFYVALSLCVLAAAGSSFWAIRSVAQRMNQGTSQIEQGGDQTWDLPGAQVEQKVEDMPEKPSKSGAQSQQSQLQPGAGTQQGQAGDSGEPAVAAEPSFVRPVDGQILQAFSGDELVYSKTLGDWRTHNGVDLAADKGSTVKNAVAGQVSAVYDDGLWGQVVEVNADDLTWRYTGLDKASVKLVAGDEVKAGQDLGTLNEAMAESGDEPHLHLEVLKGGNYIDPEHHFE